MNLRYKAVIFDLDGTILLNEEVYGKAFADVLGNHGVEVGEVDGTHIHTPGIGMEKNWERFKSMYSELDNLSVSQLSHETQDAYHKRLFEVSVRPGFYDLQEILVESGIYLALATSNDWWFIEDELEDMDLHKYFNVLVTREEVANPKPEPDIFWKAAEKLGVEPEECIVVEDSQAGLQAANEAGMRSVVVLGENTKEEDFPTADLVIADFSDINPTILDLIYDHPPKS